MQTDDILRTRRDRGDRIDIQRRGIAGQDGARLGDAIETREDVTLQGHDLKNRFDNEIGIGKLCKIGLPVDPRLSRRYLGLRQRLLRAEALVDFVNSA